MPHAADPLACFDLVLLWFEDDSENTSSPPTHSSTQLQCVLLDALYMCIYIYIYKYMYVYLSFYLSLYIYVLLIIIIFTPHVLRMSETLLLGSWICWGLRQENSAW